MTAIIITGSLCGLLAIVCFIRAINGHNASKDPETGFPYPPSKELLDWHRGNMESIKDQFHATAAAKGDKLKYLGKKKRQQIRGVDSYRCKKCDVVGSPWQINIWTKDLDTIEEDVIPGGCKCGGTVVLIDD